MRAVITATSWGYLYILHFSAPLGNPTNPRALAQHYVGWTEDPAKRLADHLAGRGAKITAAAVEKGITFEMFSWPAPLGIEKTLKKQKGTPRFCPICCRTHGWRCRQPVCEFTQLALPFDDAAEELPAIELGKADWYEVSYYRRINRRAAAPLPDNWDDGLL